LLLSAKHGCADDDGNHQQAAAATFLLDDVLEVVVGGHVFVELRATGSLALPLHLRRRLRGPGGVPSIYRASSQRRRRDATGSHRASGRALDPVGQKVAGALLQSPRFSLVKQSRRPCLRARAVGYQILEYPQGAQATLTDGAVAGEAGVETARFERAPSARSERSIRKEGQ
jgi:hypothetical protein